MPQIQILPQAPGFGEQLGRSLGGGIGQGLSSSLQSYLQGKQNEKALSALNPLFAQAGLNPQEIGSLIKSGIKPEQAMDFLKLVGEQKQKQNPLQKEVQQKTERSKQILGTVKEMRDHLKYTGSTKIPFTSSFQAKPGGLNREGLEKRNYFDTLAADIAGFFRDLETKGQLPQGLYEKVILPRLPSSEVSERENKGRLNAVENLAKRFGGLDLDDKNQERPPLESFYR